MCDRSICIRLTQKENAPPTDGVRGRGVAFERSIADRFTREPSTPLRHRIGDRAQNIRADQRRRSTEVTPGHQDALKREVLNSTDFGIHPCIGHPDAINREVLKYGTYLHTSLIA